MAIINTKTVHHAAPAQSQLARFVVADLKGGNQAHAFRLSLIQSAITEALKGNFNPIREATEFAEGKSRKAAAYQSGFAAIVRSAEQFYPDDWERGGIAKVTYTGKFDAKENASARAAVDLQTGVMLAAFDSAYLAFDANAAAEAKAKAAERKAKKEAEAVEAAAKATEMEVEPLAPSVEMDVSALVDAIATALQQGMLSGHEVTMLRVALSGYDALQTAQGVTNDGLSTAPALLRPQAVAA